MKLENVKIKEKKYYANTKTNFKENRYLESVFSLEKCENGSEQRYQNLE